MKEVERKILEANECSKLLKKNIRFSYQLVGVIPDSFSMSSSMDEIKVSKEEVQIKVENFDSDTIHLWSVKKFYDKLEMIKDMINTFQDSGAVPEDTEDPFSDQIEPLLIG